MTTLYRGLQDEFSVGEYDNSFGQYPRRPRTTPDHQHQIADHWFHKQFGVKARSATLMCTPSFQRAKDYSRVAVAEIEPIGDYTVVYSPHVRDFYDYATAFQNALVDESSLIEWLNAKHYVAENDLSNIPEGDIEVMLACAKFRIKAVHPITPHKPG